jgi:hypothetical protein
MSQKLIYYNPMRQLSIGNVVNVGIHLYRSRLRLYFRLALTAHLWLLIPVYGWAKFFAISALISRLAFNDLIGESEPASSASRPIEQRMWSCFIAAILVLIPTYLVILISICLFIILSLILLVLLGLFLYFIARLELSEPFFNWLGAVLGMLVLLIAPLSALWFYSRCFIAELPLSVENNISSVKAIKTSWKLTKGFISHVQGIMVISFLIAFPVLLITWFALGYLFGLIYSIVLLQNSAYDSIFYSLYFISLFLVNGVITMPFWQTIKAVIYYDLCCCRESLDLKLRDRKI